MCYLHHVQPLIRSFQSGLIGIILVAFTQEAFGQRFRQLPIKEKPTINTFLSDSLSSMSWPHLSFQHGISSTSPASKNFSITKVKLLPWIGARPKPGLFIRPRNPRTEPAGFWLGPSPSRFSLIGDFGEKEYLFLR